MSLGDWYLAVFCLATGVGIPAFWATPRGRALLREPGRDIRFHVGAELATGAALVTGASGVVARAAWAGLAAALALGMLGYTLLGSPGRYLDRGDAATAGLLFATLLGWVPAVVIVFVR